MITFPGHRPLIAPSLLSCDFARIGEEIRALESGGADVLHVDVMDGHFVPNITLGPPIVAAMKRAATVPLDVHLMIEKPEQYLEEFVASGADILTVHWEASTHLHRTIQAIHALDARAGVSINPATPVSVLEDILPEVDLVLVMSVNPGFGGQSFLTGSLEKIRRLREILRDIDRDVLIEVDGGVSIETAAQLRSVGADILVSGSALFGSGQYSAYMNALRG